MQVDIIGQSQQALSQMTYATSVASENINNASNPNYARQVVTFGTDSVGNVVATPVRMSNSFLNQQVYASNADVMYANSVYTMANSVDSIVTGLVTSPDGSMSNPLQSALNQINESLISLIGDDNEANRTSMLARIETFLGTTQTLNEQLGEFEDQLNTEIKQTVNQVNGMSKEIAELNKQIAKNPDDPLLLTQRDQLVSDLSKLVDLDVSENANGTVDLSIAGGLDLVRGDTAYEIDEKEDEFGNIKLELHGVDISDNPEKLGGTLGGAIYSIEEVVEATERMISKITLGFIAELNKANQEGYKADGSQGTPLVDIPDVPAKGGSDNTGDATVNISLNENNVADLTEGPIIMTKTPAGYEFYDESTGETMIASTLPADVFGYTIDQPSGTMNNGDTFEIDPIGEMTAGAEIVAKPEDIAAAGSLPVTEGDNSNLINISDAFSEGIFDGGTDSVVDELADAFVQIGNNSQSADNMLKTAVTLNNSAMANWSSYSGVSIQEEELNMLQYQQVYNSVSKVINLADEMMDSLLNII